MIISKNKLTRMKQEDRIKHAATLEGCEIPPGADKTTTVDLILAAQGNGVKAKPASTRTPGNDDLFDQLTQPDSEEHADLPKKDPRGGSREGSGRIPGISNEQSKIDNLPTQPNRAIKATIKTAFDFWAKFIGCPAMKLDKEELEELAIDWTQVFELYGLKIPEGIAIPGKAALSTASTISSRVAMKEMHKAKEANQAKAEKAAL